MKYQKMYNELFNEFLDDNLEIFLEYQAEEKINAAIESIREWLIYESNIGIWFGETFFIEFKNSISFLKSLTGFFRLVAIPTS